MEAAPGQDPNRPPLFAPGRGANGAVGSDEMPYQLPVVDPLIGQTVGGYVVEYSLGEGATGLVYRVRHPVLNRHFAIKVLRPELAADATSSSNFVREAHTLSQLKHPSIVDIIDFGPVGDGRQYMVMEYLCGRTLERELLEESRLEPERALTLADEILDALSAAHSVGVIHRDLKPSNVFLAKVSGGRELVKLLDFGLAKQQPLAVLPHEAPGAAAVGDSGIAGTPEYIAPEQAYGPAASKQSDLYSFGVMLFRMLTGALPFEADPDLPGREQIIALMKKHVHQVPPTIHEAARDVKFPVGLGEVVADLLKKAPADRPSSAETVRKRLVSVARALHQEATHLGPNPLTVPPPPPPPTPPTPSMQVTQPMQATPPPPTTRPKQRSSVLLGGSLILLGGMTGAWWWGGRQLPLTAPEPQAEARPDAGVLLVVGTVVDESPLEVLTALSALSARPPPPRAKRPAPLMEPLPDCAPDAEWKRRARADLNELATRAAVSNAELTLWAAEREHPLSAAIDAARSASECRDVGLQLVAFKQKVTGP